MLEAKLYQKLENNQVKCELCQHGCLINDKKTGLCAVRYNQGGILYSAVYGKIIAKNIDPIEKKPLFHFMPGSKIYSIGTVGCNLRCVNCQNADISQAPKIIQQEQRITEMPGQKMAPQQVIDEAQDNDCLAIAYTYNEPTVFFEFALDCMKLAQKNGLKNVWVSNGYMSQKCLDEITPYLDAINVDLKFFSNDNYTKVCGALLKPILENIKTIKKNGVWLELTTLIIPEYNDSEEELKNIANFIAKELDIYTPWHISRFFPNYQLTEVAPTDREKLTMAYEIGKQAGLKYVYVGNVLDASRASTYCSQDHLVIERSGMSVKRFDSQGKCAKCGEDIILVE
jgi:pyruvate formate lyase activating enzyme